MIPEPWCRSCVVNESVGHCVELVLHISVSVAFCNGLSVVTGVLSLMKGEDYSISGCKDRYLECC